MINIDSYTKVSIPDKIKKDLVVLMQKEWFELNAPYHEPPLAYFERLISTPDPPTEKQIFLIAKSNLKIIGYMILWLNIGINEHTANFDPYVKEKYRKQGVFKELIKNSIKVLPPIVKFIHFTMRTDESAPFPNDRKNFVTYLKNQNSKIVYNARRSASEIKKFNRHEITAIATKMKENARKNGFSIVKIQNGEFQRQTRFKIDDYVILVERIKNDMPKEERMLDELKISVEDYLKRYERIKTFNDHAITFVMIDNVSHLPIAYTETWFYWGQPDLAAQGDTGVLHEYRGKKLGLTLKYQMLNEILNNEDFKEVEHWGTHTASSNLHMIKINEELGYEENGVWTVFEIKVENLRNLIPNTT